MRANGSCIDWRMLNHSSIESDRVGLDSVPMATAMAGPRVIKRVIATRFHAWIRIFKNPSITSCPAKVPVIVEACPAAKSPVAQKYFALEPRKDFSTSPATWRPIEPQTPWPSYSARQNSEANFGELPEKVLVRPSTHASTCWLSEK